MRSNTITIIKEVVKLLTIKKGNETLVYDINDAKELVQLSSHISSSDILSKSSTLKIKTDEDKVTLDTQNISVESNGTSDEYTEYCFNGLMYDHSSGMFYIGPDQMSNFVPILDAKAYFEALLDSQLGKSVDLDIASLDKFLQNYKMGEGKLNNLLSGLVNSSVGVSRGKTRLESLVSGLANISGSSTDSAALSKPFKLSLPKAEKLMAMSSKILMNYAVNTIKAFASLPQHSASVTNTLINVSQSVKPVVESGLFQGKIMKLVDRADHGLVRELSTNPIFSPTSRGMMRVLIDTESANMFTKSRKLRKDYNNVMKVMNAKDLSQSGDTTGIFDIALGTSEAPLTADIDASEFKTNTKLLIRNAEVTAASQSLRKYVPDLSLVINTLTSVKTDAEASELGSAEVLKLLSLKNVRLMTKFMTKM